MVLTCFYYLFYYFWNFSIKERDCLHFIALRDVKGSLCLMNFYCEISTKLTRKYILVSNRILAQNCFCILGPKEQVSCRMDRTELILLNNIEEYVLHTWVTLTTRQHPRASRKYWNASFILWFGCVCFGRLLAVPTLFQWHCSKVHQSDKAISVCIIHTEEFTYPFVALIMWSGAANKKGSL